MYLDRLDSFSILQLPSNASPQDIRRSYQHLSKICHPDKHGNSIYFRSINSAYKLLGNPFWQFLKINFGDTAVKNYEDHYNEFMYFEHLFNQLDREEVVKGSVRLELLKNEVKMRIQQLANMAMFQKSKANYLDRISTRIIIDTSHNALACNTLIRNIECEVKIPLPSVMGSSFELACSSMFEERNHMQGLTLEMRRPLKIGSHDITWKNTLNFDLRNFELQPILQMNKQNYRIIVQPFSLDMNGLNVGRLEVISSAYGSEFRYLISPRGNQFIMHRYVAPNISQTIVASKKSSKTEVGTFLNYELSKDLKLIGGFITELDVNGNQLAINPKANLGFATKLSNDWIVEVKNIISLSNSHFFQIKINNSSSELVLYFIVPRYALLFNALIVLALTLFKKTLNHFLKSNPQRLFKLKYHNQQHLENKYRALQMARNDLSQNFHALVGFQQRSQGLVILNCLVGSQSNLQIIRHSLQTGKEVNLPINTEVFQCREIIQAKIGFKCRFKTTMSSLINELYNPCLDEKEDPVLLLRYRYRGKEVVKSWSNKMDEIEIPDVSKGWKERLFDRVLACYDCMTI